VRDLVNATISASSKTSGLSEILFIVEREFAFVSDLVEAWYCSASDAERPVEVDCKF